MGSRSLELRGSKITKTGPIHDEYLKTAENRNRDILLSIKPITSVIKYPDPQG